MELLIKTLDSYGEKSSQKIKTSKEISGKGRKYDYTDELGETKIFVMEDRVQIMRKGSINSNQMIKPNEETVFKYKTPYMTKHFTLKTNSFNVTETTVELSYSIFEEKEEINEIKLSILEV